jgi:hypothetical protein
MTLSPLRERYTFPLWTYSWTTDYRIGKNYVDVNTYNGVETNTNSRFSHGLKDWRAIINFGNNATTPFEGQEHTLSFKQQGDVQCVYWDFGLPRYEAFFGIETGNIPSLATTELAIDTSAAEQQAASRWFSRLRSRRSHFQGGVVLGEMREVLRMIRSPAKSLYRGVDRYLNALKVKRKLAFPNRKRALLKKGTYKERVREANERREKLSQILSDTWLEYSFGWKPLFSDISDGMKAYDKLLSESPRQMLYATGIAEDVAWPYRNLGNSLFGALAIRFTQKVSKKVFVTYYGMLEDIRNGARPNQQLADLGLSITQDFVPTVWELLPWSFLVDYFTNIGDILSASTTDTSSVRWTSRTTRRVSTATQSYVLDEKTFRSNYPDKRNQFYGTCPLVERKRKSVVRESIAPVSVPDFQVQVPGRPQQWLNMLTLAASRKSLQPYI